MAAASRPDDLPGSSAVSVRGSVPLALGAAWAALGIGLGAFGAHGLRAQVAAGALSAGDLDIFETGVRYQMYAALALMALGLALPRLRGPALLLWLGSLIFSLSLYALVLLDMRWLGAVTPIGGVLMVAGLLWAALQLWPRS